MKLAIIALAASAAAAGGVALAAKPPSPLTAPPPAGTGLPSGQCFRPHDIRNHTIADRQTLLMDVNRDTYRVTVDGGCLAGAITSDPIITRQPPGASIVCRPIDLDLSISRSGFVSRCIVQSIVRMSPEEVAALPRKLKP